jgi:hypothetical protein
MKKESPKDNYRVVYPIFKQILARSETLSFALTRTVSFPILRYIASWELIRHAAWIGKRGSPCFPYQPRRFYFAKM